MGMSLKFSTDGLAVRLWFIKYLNFWEIFSYIENQNIVVKKIPNFLAFLHCSFQMDEVDFVIIWRGEIPRLMKQMFRLVLCCLRVVGIYFLGRLLGLMLNMHQNTRWGMGNAENNCLKQSGLLEDPVVGLEGAPCSPGSKSGHSRSSPARQCLGALGKEPLPQCTVPNAAPLTSPFADISAVAVTCWRTRQVECLHFSTLLSVTSPGERFPSRFQPCPPGGTWLPSRGVVMETCDVNFALVFRVCCASVPEDPEQSSTNAAPAFPAAALLVAWSGAQLHVNGGIGSVGDPSVVLHAASLSQAGHLGTKWLHSSGKSRPPPCRGLWGKEQTRGSGPSLSA